jgi:hypothetical protein
MLKKNLKALAKKTVERFLELNPEFEPMKMRFIQIFEKVLMERNLEQSQSE